VETELLKLPETRATFAIGGFDFNGGFIGNKGVILPASSLGRASWRRAFCRGAERKMLGIYSSISEARVVATSPPAIQGLGSFSGFSFILEPKRQ